MYLSNDQRIRLGLQHYGSDVLADVALAATAALVEADRDASPAHPRKTTRTRARNRKGEFKGNDLSTPGVNEAFIDG